MRASSGHAMLEDIGDGFYIRRRHWCGEIQINFFSNCCLHHSVTGFLNSSSVMRVRSSSTL